jgi:23S rRNA pseudouridine1911/1915/1917 synthase
LDPKECKVEEIVVEPSEAGERIDRVLARRIPSLSRSKVQKLIENGQVRVDGEVCRASSVLHNGVKITVQTTEEKPAAREEKTVLAPRKADFEVLYEDESLIVINKPAGLVVHPGAGTTDPTLAEGVLFHLGRDAVQYDENSDIDSNRPGIVHRLDKDTSGVMVVAKSEKAHEHLSQQFREKTNLREYVAILDGVLPASSMIFDSYLHRDPRHRLRFASVTNEEYAQIVATKSDVSGYRYAKTSFQVKKVYGERISLVAVRLATGRTHQIRVHSRCLGAPVLGDAVYGARKKRWPLGFPGELITELSSVPRQMLHARVLGFVHPNTHKKLAFEASLPEDFKNVLKLLDSALGHP